MKKHFIAFLLAMCLCMTQMPAYVFASETTSNYHQVETVTADYVNPLYADTVTEDDLLTEEEADDELVLSDSESSICQTDWNNGYGTYATKSYCESKEDCAALFREGLKKRNVKIVIYYHKDSQITSDELNEIGALAMAHTGEPTEGDYLKYQYSGWRGGASGYTSNGSYFLTLTFVITYYTTYSQEATMNSSVAELLDDLSLEGLSDYQKLYTIYNYVCSNVTYDYDTLSDDTYKLKFTAYAALQNKTAVCQGYAVLMYRLLLEEGIDARVITGIGNGGSHAWNIVKIDGKYYDIDSTWDASYKQAGYNFQYFLKSDENFTDHERGDEFTTDEFTSAYPVSTTNYVTSETPAASSETEEEEETTHTHEATTLSAVAATCTASGLTEGSVCATCGEILKAQEVVPATGHTVVVDEAVAATCKSTGLTEGSHCSVCGEVITAQEVTPKTDDHTWDEGVVTKEATCCKAGERTYTCTECGATVTEEIPATGNHTYDEGVITEKATCTENGVKTFTCTEDGCDASYTEAIPATGHSVVVDKAVAATCTKEGLTEGSHCETCGEVIEAQETTPMIDHLAVVDAGVPATCTEEGLTEGAHCAICDKVLVEQETIPTIDHTVVADKAVAATCTETGLTEGSHCSVCGKVIKAQETVPTIDHSVVTDKAVAATCTETGLTEGSHCSVCGKVIKAQEITSKLGHTWNAGEVTKAATGTKTGEMTYTCTVCGATKTEEIAATGVHTYDDGVVTKKPTCTEAGEMTYTCTEDGCDASYTEAIPATGHTVVIDKAVAATCTEEGLTEGSHCSVCGKVIKAQETVPTIDHTVVTDKAVAATCTETGLTEGSHCSVCGKVIKAQETIEKTGHTWNDGEVTKKATCEEAGEKTYTCTICGKTKTEEIAATGEHSYNDGEVTKKATCKETGVKTYTCTVCGKTKTEKIATTAHSFTKYIYNNDATYTADGTETATCSVCGATDTRTASGTMLKLSTTSTKASNTTSGIKLVWNRIFGASGYKIFRKSSTATTYTRIATVSNSATVAFTDTTAKNGTTYTYKIKAYNSAQQSSSETATIARLSSVSITGLSSKNMNITWDKNTKASGYQIVYATKSSFSDAKTINLSSYKSVSKAITGLSKGKTCYVKVRSYKIVNGKKYYSSYSSVKKIKATR